MIRWFYRLCAAIIGLDDDEQFRSPAPKLHLPKRSLMAEWRRLK